MKYQVTLPDYYNIKHYKEFDRFAHLDEQEQMLAMVSVLTENTEDEIREWPVQLIIKVYNELNSWLKDIQPEFYPVIEWKDKMYGFQPMHKMSAGEYIDFDNLAKDTKTNINELLAILYRPITRNKLDSNKFAIKTAIRAYNGNIENPFDYYDVETYNVERRKEQAKEMDEFPIQVALGALTFFLDSKAPLLKNSVTYFPQWDEVQMKMKKEAKSKIQLRSANITAGWLRSTNLPKHPSYPSQEIKQ